MANKVIIETNIVSLRYPITIKIVSEATRILNIVFNLSEFEIELSKHSFVRSNRPEFCKNGQEISGSDVHADFISKKKIEISLTVKKLTNLWKQYVYKTMGETHPAGNSIITYHWWLDNENERDLIISYATHIGHEIFHTNYFGYVHDPGAGSKKFVNEKDVTYMIDDILEKLIKENY
jgi:hypothetical protein